MQILLIVWKEKEKKMKEDQHCLNTYVLLRDLHALIHHEIPTRFLVGIVVVDY